jgi:DNA-binding MarR family transcriptional regulator
VCGDRPSAWSCTRNRMRPARRATDIAARLLTLPAFVVYTCIVGSNPVPDFATPCLCDALRQTARAVSRLYDREMRRHGLRTGQYALLAHVHLVGQIRQRDLGARISTDETTLTRNLSPLIEAGWVGVQSGKDRREKILSLTRAGQAKLRQARPAWERAQNRLRSQLPERAWNQLLVTLPALARIAEKA